MAPRGVPHAFLVTSPTARVLTLQTPGSAEAFYRGASEPAGADSDPAGPVDFNRVQAAAEQAGGMTVARPAAVRSRRRSTQRSSRSAIASATASTVRCVLARGMVGRIDASATTRPSTPCTRPSASTTVSAAPGRPMRQVPAGW